MVQLNAIQTGNDIMISKDSFEHLLNCLANQKFISVPDKQSITEKTEIQDYIDDFWVQGMDLLNSKKDPDQLEIFKAENMAQTIGPEGMDMLLDK